MTLTLLRARNEASPARTLQPTENSVPRYDRRPLTRASTGSVVRPTDRLIFAPSGTTVDSGPISPGELSFWQQRRAFHAIPPTTLSGFTGEYVMSRDGRIIDHDRDLWQLTRRWAQTLGGVPVYIGRVNAPMEVDIDTPFID